MRRDKALMHQTTQPVSPTSSRPISPQETGSSATSASHRHSPSPSSSSLTGNGAFPMAEEPDPDSQLLAIIGHISSETTGALHKEGITELHHFLKAYPHKKPRVEKMLESTGAAFRKYINRALASRASEDRERNVAVADTLSSEHSPSLLLDHAQRLRIELESNQREPMPASIVADDDVGSRPLKHNSPPEESAHQDKLSRLHDIFQYRSSTLSAGSSQGRTTPSIAGS